MTPTSWIIATAPPNPNGDLHLGHLSGPFLGADVLARYLRSRGDDVVHVGYVDEHSTYVPRRAGELGRTADDVAYDLGNRIASTLELANMHPDFLGRPKRDVWHDEIVQGGFLRLLHAGAVIETEGDVYHCPVEDIPLYEAEIRGRCHHCEASSDGFYCEECGRPQESGRLLDPRCTSCNAIPILRRERRLAVALEPFRARLEALWDRMPTRPRLRAYLDMLLNCDQLPLTPVSRVGEYGVPVPLDGWKGYYLDTWFSGLFGYIAATEGLRRVRGIGRGAAMWQEPDTQLVEFIGIDCSFSHAVLWVAMAIALDPMVTPFAVMTNEFYTLEGAKFSTSRGHAIWGGDFLQKESADDVRFHLCLTGPESAKSDFRVEDFRQTQRDVLAGGLDVIGSALCGDERSGGDDRPLLDMVARLRAETAAVLDPASFSPAQATALIAKFATEDRDRTLDAIAGSSITGRRLAAIVLSDVLGPVMPTWAERLKAEITSAPTPSRGSAAVVWP